eukprot:jgi/Bigna1/75906/fgenesh1_pg.37_\
MAGRSSRSVALIVTVAVLLPTTGNPVGSKVLPDGYRLTPERFFDDFQGDNYTWTRGEEGKWGIHMRQEGEEAVSIANGHLNWEFLPEPRHAEFLVLDKLVDESTIKRLIHLLEAEEFDTDLDTVDGLATFEFYLEKNGGQEAIAGIQGKPDADPAIAKARAATRFAAAEVNDTAKPFTPPTNPRLTSAPITEIVNSAYTTPVVAEDDGDDEGAQSSFNNNRRRLFSSCGESRCVPCFSFIRRYAAGDARNRSTHDTHFDEQALVTAHKLSARPPSSIISPITLGLSRADTHAFPTTQVISLSTHGQDFTGGLFVAAGGGRSKRRFLALRTGDVVLHQSDLLHGVDVISGTRWSWVIWFKDAGNAARCSEIDRRKWTQAAASSPSPGGGKGGGGDPIVQYLHAKRSTSQREKERWLRRAANGRFRMAQNELGVMLRDKGKLQEARKWLTKAARSEPAAMLNLAMMILTQGGGRAGQKAESEQQLAIKLLRRAARLGLPEAMTNLGVAHYKGLAGPSSPSSSSNSNWERAIGWWRASGRPEALILAITVLRGVGRGKEADEILQELAWKGHPPSCRGMMLRMLEKTTLESFTLPEAKEALRWARRASSPSVVSGEGGLSSDEVSEVLEHRRRLEARVEELMITAQRANGGEDDARRLVDESRARHRNNDDGGGGKDNAHSKGGAHHSKTKTEL